MSYPNSTHQPIIIQAIVKESVHLKGSICRTSLLYVLLSLAVEVGNVDFTGQPVEVKYAGCGKVVGVK